MSSTIRSPFAVFRVLAHGGNVRTLKWRASLFRVLDPRIPLIHRSAVPLGLFFRKKQRGPQTSFRAPVPCPYVTSDKKPGRGKDMHTYMDMLSSRGQSMLSAGCLCRVCTLERDGTLSIMPGFTSRAAMCKQINKYSSPIDPTQPGRRPWPLCILITTKMPCNAWKAHACEYGCALYKL